MNDRDAMFVSKMRSLTDRGIDFQRFLKDNLREILGETPSEVLYACIGVRATKSPDEFVVKIRGVFGEGAEAIYRELERRAGADTERQEDTALSLHESLAPQLTRWGGDDGDSRSAYLHDHRSEDRSGAIEDNASAPRGRDLTPDGVPVPPVRAPIRAEGPHGDRFGKGGHIGEAIKDPKGLGPARKASGDAARRRLAYISMAGSSVAWWKDYWTS